MESITPSAGSLKGGTLMTIQGKGFGSVDARHVNVRVAGTKCEVQKVTDTTIECVTLPIDPESLLNDGFPGITCFICQFNV